jgi:hypothetical protein
MYCEACGQVLAGGDRYCLACGAAVRAPVLSVPIPASAAPLADAELAHARATRLVSPGVTLGEDGVLRWVYELNMWKNPTLLITIWKVLLLAALFPALLVAVLRLTDGDGWPAAASTFAQVGGLVLAVVTGLMLLAYPLVAWLNGGKYCVIFEMDDAGIRHIQMRRQFRRNQVLAFLTVMAGAASGSAQTAGAGLLAGSRRSLYTDFAGVRSVRAIESRQVIHLTSKLVHNQVYAEPADFAFVLAYIQARIKPAAGGTARQQQRRRQPPRSEQAAGRS